MPLSLSVDWSWPEVITRPCQLWMPPSTTKKTGSSRPDDRRGRVSRPTPRHAKRRSWASRRPAFVLVAWLTPVPLRAVRSHVSPCEEDFAPRQLRMVSWPTATSGTSVPSLTGRAELWPACWKASPAPCSLAIPSCPSSTRPQSMSRSRRSTARLEFESTVLNRDADEAFRRGRIRARTRRRRVGRTLSELKTSASAGLSVSICGRREASRSSRWRGFPRGRSIGEQVAGVRQLPRR